MESKYIKIKSGKYTIFSGLPEFGYELIATLPYSYYLYTKGLLQKTISGFDTKCLYYFSPDHEEIKEKRSFRNWRDINRSQFPNIFIHSNQLDWEYFTPPPLKEYYKDKAITFGKETIVICNMIRNEWGKKGYNYIEKDTLFNLLDILSNNYSIVLIQSSDFTSNYQDHFDFVYKGSLNEKILENKGVIPFGMLRKKYPELSINELQCRIYAGCQKFITSNGGNCILTSYFGGENIIYTHKCREIDPEVNSFYSWYYRLGKSSISVVNNDKELCGLVESKWVRKDNLFNILIRTSGRKNYFHDCIVSVMEQNYSNYNIYVSVDDEVSREYVRKFPCAIIDVEKNKLKKPENKKFNNPEYYGIEFPYNNYFNIIQDNITDQGYTIYLDDDDMLKNDQVLKNLNKLIKEKKPELVFWRVEFPDRLVPSDKHFFNRQIVNKDIDTVGYCFKTSLKPQWEPWKRGDFRVAKWLAEHTKNNCWINKIYTKLQRTTADGFGKRDDKIAVGEIYENPPLAVIISAFKTPDEIIDCLKTIIVNMDQLNNVRSNVFIGIDGCMDTYESLTHQGELVYNCNHKINIFYSKENCGTYLIRNSLLKKIDRSDTIILFFDSDDIMPPNYIKSYYYKMLEYIKNNRKVMIRPAFIGIDDKYIEQSKDITSQKNVYVIINELIKKGEFEDVLPYIVYAIKNCVYTNNMAMLLYNINRYVLLNKKEYQKLDEFAYNFARAHGTFMARYSDLEELGFFHPMRVAQDTDLLKRAKICGIETLYFEDKLPAHIRRISTTSLSQGNQYGRNSIYRKNVMKKNDYLIKKGIYKAMAKSVELFYAT